jgi:hypothetical protein
MPMFRDSTMRWGLVASVTGSFLLAMSVSSQAADSGCAAVRAAVALQSKSPFHATVSSASAQGASTPAAKSEMVWIDNTLYLQMGGRWVGGPMPPERALVGVTGGNLPFSECKQLAGATISGQATTVYSAVMQSGEHVQLFISSSSGQLLRETLDVRMTNVTVDFEYTNVRAPALSK